MKKGKQRLVCRRCGSDLRREKGELTVCRNRACVLFNRPQQGDIKE